MEKKENYLRAIENYEKKLQKNQNNADDYYNIGWNYGQLGEYEKALKNYEEALKLNPNSADTYFGIGWTYEKLNQNKKAIENYEKALKLNPNDANTYFGIGWNYGQLGEYEKSLKKYEEALKLNPNDANTYHNIGWTYGQLEKYEKSLKKYEEALKLNPNSADTYFGIGWTYERLNQNNKAIENYEKALKLNPNDAKIYHNIGWNYGRLGEYEKALENCKKAIELNYNNPNIYFGIGWLYSQLEKYEKAIENYEKVLELNPNDANTYYNIGWCYEKLNQNENAIENYQKAVALEPNNILFKNLKDKVKNKKGKKIIDSNTNIEEKFQNEIPNSKNEEKENFQYKSSQEESKELVQKNFLTFADILGWKGIWQRDKNKNSKSRNIDKMKSIKENLIKIKDKLLKEIQYTDNNIESIANINLISDTFIIASNDIKIHNKLCKELVTQCLKNDLLIRGATAYGEYLSEDMIYIGEAVDEAASWHELAEEVAIFYTISARLKLEDILEEKIKELNKGNKKIKLNNYLREIELINSEVQLKKGKMDTYLISWIDNKENTNKFKEIMKKETIYPELSLKYLNTEKQINNFKDNLRYKKEK